MSQNVVTFLRNKCLWYIFFVLPVELGQKKYICVCLGYPSRPYFPTPTLNINIGKIGGKWKKKKKNRNIDHVLSITNSNKHGYLCVRVPCPAKRLVSNFQGMHPSKGKNVCNSLIQWQYQVCGYISQTSWFQFKNIECSVKAKNETVITPTVIEMSVCLYYMFPLYTSYFRFCS